MSRWKPTREVHVHVYMTSCRCSTCTCTCTSLYKPKMEDASTHVQPRGPAGSAWSHCRNSPHHRRHWRNPQNLAAHILPRCLLSVLSPRVGQAHRDVTQQWWSLLLMARFFSRMVVQRSRRHRSKRPSNVWLQGQLIGVNTRKLNKQFKMLRTLVKCKSIASENVDSQM